MNKKFSTLMAGLLLAGGMATPVFAESFLDVKAKADAGTYDLSSQYFFVFVDGGNPSSLPDLEDPFASKYEILKSDGTHTLATEALKMDDSYLWKVVPTTPVNGKVYYQLVNKKDGLLKVKVGEDEYNAFDPTLSEDMLVFDASHGFRGDLTSTFPTSWFYNLQPVETNEDVTDPNKELNELYNATGFNFVLGDKTIANIFAEQRVRAIKLDQQVSPDKVNSGDNVYPAGIYFVTKTPEGKFPSNGLADKQYEYLQNCEFIVVNPIANDINDADKRKTGTGFQFIKKLGKEMNHYCGDITTDLGKQKAPHGKEVSVNNACFSVSKHIDGAYGLKLAKVWFNPNKADDVNDIQVQTLKEKVGINTTTVVGEDKEGKKYLTTDNSVADKFYYIFAKEDCFTEDVFNWIHTDRAAAYNIQFVGDESADVKENVVGKYLYVPFYNETAAGPIAYAKGEKFLNKNMPETQFVVTGVNEKDHSITLTNRANPEASCEVKLYCEDAANGIYSLTFKEDDKALYTVLYENEEGDIVAGAKEQSLQGAWVKITEVEDKNIYNGAWDVDNLTEVTMMFARDNEPSSNKLYTKVAGATGQLYSTNDLSEALQFRLVKSPKPDYIYIPTVVKVSDGKEKPTWKSIVKSQGDTIAYYTYKFEAYKDGMPMEKYLRWNTNGYYNLDAQGELFVIKDNYDADESVSIINTSEESYGPNRIMIKGWNEEEGHLHEWTERAISSVKPQENMNANYVKTYLNLESPEVSLDSNKTYVTMATELGNYVNMKDDRDGIIASDDMTLRLFVTDVDRFVPSFLVTTGWNENTKERMFLFNSVDSVNYKVATGEFNKEYALNGNPYLNKAIFRPGKLGATNTANDTIYTTIKGKKTAVSNVADQNKNVQAGLNRYKFQIVEDLENEGFYFIRQEGYYLFNMNGYLVFANPDWAQFQRNNALRVEVADVDAPTANETINAANNVVVAGVNGAVIVKGAEGKNVIVSTILGKVVANEVVSSDNATIAAPAGIVVVSVDGESFKVVVK